MLPLVFLFIPLYLNWILSYQNLIPVICWYIRWFIRYFHKDITSVYSLRQLWIVSTFRRYERHSLVRGSTRYVNCFPRCYNKMNFFPDTEYSVWCTTNNTLRGRDGIEFVVACCDHSDYCNRDLRPSFPTYESRGRSNSRFTNHLGGGTINCS